MKGNDMVIRRSYLESPIMDARKWEKVPTIQADVVLADMEDSVPPDLKEQARIKVAELVKDPSFFAGREFICRPNNLSTPWGRQDVSALARANAPFILYPKARDAAEVREVGRVFAEHGGTPEIMVLIETPQAVLHLEEIASCAGVTGLMFGPGDLSIEAGISLLDGPRFFSEGFLYARAKTLMTARAYGLEATEGLFVADLKDLESFRQSVELSRLFGFTGNIVFYPPHAQIVNEVRTPTAEETRWFRRVIEAYEDARKHGQVAVTLDGKWLTVHQYTEAQRSLQLAEALGVA